MNFSFKELQDKFQELTEKLKNIDVNKVLEDLKNTDVDKILERVKSFDINNIDFSSDLSILRKGGINLIRVVLVIVLFFSLKFVWNDYKDKKKALKSDIAKLEEKLIEVNKWRKLDAEKKDFVENFPKELSVAKMGEILSKIAAKNNSKISEFTPKESFFRNGYETFMKEQHFQVSFVSNSYQNMLLFIYDLENSEYSIHLEDWNILESFDSALEKINIGCSIQIAALSLVQE